MQEALLRALATWPTDPPADPKGWLITVAWRKFLDPTRADSARQAREARVEAEPPAGPGRGHRRHPAALLPVRPPVAHARLRGGAHAAGGGRPDDAPDRAGLPGARGDHGPAHQPGQAHRSGVRFDEPGDLATVLRVLYLVFNEGYSGEVDLADEAIRLTRQVRSMTDDEEASGLLALMLLHHARRAARTTPDGALVPLAEQDRSRWDTELIAEGVAILQAALARDRLGEYQAQAAIEQARRSQ